MHKRTHPLKKMRPITQEELHFISGGIWHIIGPIVAIAVGFIADGIRHRKDPDLAKREGLDNYHQ